MFPPLPDWNGLHPLVVHFPIALLLTAPLLVIIGLFRRQDRTWPAAALVLMVLGTVGMFVALSTGEAAEDSVQIGGAAEAVLERHEETAELARNLFIALTLVLAAIVAAPLALKARWTPAVSLIAQGLFLLAYLGGAGVLANTAHEGGRLVHEFGIHALPAAGTPFAPPFEPPQDNDD